MSDVDINPFGEHESRTDEPTDEHISLTPCRGRKIDLGTRLRRAGNFIQRRVSKNQTNERLC